MFVIQPFVEYARIPETAFTVEGKEVDEEEERGGSRIKKREREGTRDAGIHPTR